MSEAAVNRDVGRRVQKRIASHLAPVADAPLRLGFEVTKFGARGREEGQESVLVGSTAVCSKLWSASP